MVEALLLAGVAVAAFVGINIGGSSTGVAFGPATGSGTLSMRAASGLMAVFVVLGGMTLGTNVVHTLGEGIVPPAAFSPVASVAVLLFIGLGILLGNVLKVSVSTSETAVVAVVGMGAALGVTQWDTVGVVVMWWIVSPILGFWLSAFVGRYLYDDVVGWLRRDGDVGRGGRLLAVGIGCYMAFSAGASNVANAVAPLVGSGQVALLPAAAFGGLAIGVGAFVLGPRTMETVGEDITDLTLEAALVVEVVAATIISGLSWAGIPASLAITTTSCVIGLGWGRASRRVPLAALVNPEGFTTADRSAWVEDQLSLYDPRTVKRVVAAWVASPTVAGVVAFVAFVLAEAAGLLA